MPRLSLYRHPVDAFHWLHPGGVNMAFAAACLSHATARNLLAGMDPSWWDAKQPEHSEGSIWKAFVPIAMWKKNVTQQPTQGSVSICFYPQLKLAKRCLRLQTHRSRGLVYGPHNVLELGICRAGQISDLSKPSGLGFQIIWKLSVISLPGTHWQLWALLH